MLVSRTYLCYSYNEQKAIVIVTNSSSCFEQFCSQRVRYYLENEVHNLSAKSANTHFDLTVMVGEPSIKMTWHNLQKNGHLTRCVQSVLGGRTAFCSTAVSKNKYVTGRSGRIRARIYQVLKPLSPFKRQGYSSTVLLCLLFANSLHLTTFSLPGWDAPKRSDAAWHLCFDLEFGGQSIFRDRW